MPAIAAVTYGTHITVTQHFRHQVMGTGFPISLRMHLIFVRLSEKKKGIARVRKSMWDFLNIFRTVYVSMSCNVKDSGDKHSLCLVCAILAPQVVRVV